MKIDGQKLAELISFGCQRFVDPLKKRVAALENRDEQFAILEERVRLLEAARDNDAQP
jgi:hypothetical protein